MLFICKSGFKGFHRVKFWMILLILLYAASKLRKHPLARHANIKSYLRKTQFNAAFGLIFHAVIRRCRLSSAAALSSGKQARMKYFKIRHGEG